MSAPPIFFVAGVPRSGSTLLLNLLGQNPGHHVTPTNGLIGLVSGIENSWMELEAFKAQGLGKVQHRIESGVRGLLYGFYEQELSRGQVVFDKNRAWPRFIEILEKSLRRPVRVIVTVRDIRSVVASFEKLHRKTALERNAFRGQKASIEAQTIQGRANLLLGKEGVIGMPVNLIRDALQRGTADRLVVVPYRALCASPQLVLSDIHRALGLAPFTYDTENIGQLTQEDDTIYGWGKGLHDVKSRVEAPATNPWEGILPPGLCQMIGREFADINQLAGTIYSTEPAPKP